MPASVTQSKAEDFSSRAGAGPGRSPLRLFSFGFALAAVLVALLASLSWRAGKTAREQANRVVHTYAVMEALEATLGLVLDAEIGAHVFALTGEDAFLGESYRAAETNLAGTLARLRALIEDPGQKIRLTELDLRIAEAETARRQVMVERRANGVPPDSAMLGRDKAMLDAIRATLGEMKASQMQLAKERTQLVEASRSRSDRLAFAGTALGIAALLAAMVLLLRRAAASNRAQEDVRAINARLEQRVAARTAALREEMQAREQAQIALRLSEQRLGGIFDSAMDAIITVNEARRITLFNHAAERMFGCAASAALGKPIDQFLPERFRTAHGKHMEAFGGSGVSSQAMNPRGAVSGLRANGEEFPIEASISQVEAGGEKFFTVILRDITERQRAEAALREANEDLEDKIALRTSELREAKEEAESADRLKSAFVASMSHELRTPLNAVIGFTGTLLMKLPGPLNAGQEKQLRTVQGSAKHLLSLINDILDLGRIESGKMEPHIEAIDASSVILEVAAALRPAAETKGIDFKVRTPSGPVRLNTDRRALHQILLNLTSNAIKFTDVGTVSLSLRQSPSGIECAVGDTGIGIRDADLPRLFRAFEQLENVGRRRQGTGLGLHLSQKMATMLGGRIIVQSEAGRGSCFTLVIPTDSPCLPVS